MSDILINQLHFKSNSHTVLPFLKAKTEDHEAPAQFSLNSIKQMPKELALPLTPELQRLSQMNMKVPDFDDKIRKKAKNSLFGGNKTNKAKPDELANEIKALKDSVDDSKKELLQKAEINYREHGFFCFFDWRMTFWGTSEDICSVDETTFVKDTKYLEFHTKVTPPLPALITLADTFPSVRFYLHYRYQSEDSWTQMEIFPITPFGY